MTTATHEGVVVEHIDEVEALPEGSRIRNIHGIELERTDTGLREVATHAKRAIRGLTLRDMRWTVIHGPVHEVDYSVEVVEDYRTLAQYKQWFRTGIWGQAIRHGIEEHRVRAALMELQCRQWEPTLGLPIHYYDGLTVEAMPHATTVLFGDVHARGRAYRLSGRSGYVSRSSSDNLWVPLLGRGAGISTGYVVGGVDTRAPWVDERGGVDQLQLVHEFKGRAWEVGNELQEESDWCATYQSCMASVEVGPWVEEPLPALFTADQVQSLNEGAVVSYKGRHPCLFKRDARSTNPAGTVRLGPGEGHWAQHAHLLWDGRGDMCVQCTSVPEMQAMPLGTVITMYRDGDPFTKTEADTWTQNQHGYTYQSHQFSASDMYYTSIPGGNE